MSHLAMHRVLRVFVLSLLFSAAPASIARSQDREEAVQRKPADAELSLSHVTLYSSGMGWFVFEGKVAEDSRYALTIRESEVSDVLRTLNVSDPSGDFSVHLEAGRDPIRRSPTLPDTQTLGDLLLSMTGEPVRIRTRLKADLQGRLVSVELRPEHVDDSVIEREVLTVLTDDGLKRIPLADVAELFPKREPFRDLLNEALDHHHPENEEPRRKLEIDFVGDETRQVTVALLRPAPMWKSTYRMHEGVFQHRAIVENTTDSDWRDVSLALVDGNPVTFRVDLDRIARARRQQVARPVSRPEVPAAIAESMAPPETPTADQRNNQAKRTEGGSYGGEYGSGGYGGMGGGMGGMGGGMGGMGGGMGGMGGGMGGMGGGMGGGRAGGGAFGETADAFGNVESSGEQAPDFGRSFAIEHSTSGARAAAGKAGQSLEISFPSVSVPAGEAIVLDAKPFDVRSQLASVYRHASETRAPLLALQLENESKMRLPAGPLSVFLETTGYAGDAMLPLLSPGVERLVGFAMDNGVRVSPQPIRTSAEPSRLLVDASNHLIHVTQTETKTETFLIDNRSGTERQVLVDHEGPDEGFRWSEKSPDRETTEEGWRFSVEVPDGARETLELITEKSTASHHDFASVDLSRVRHWLNQKELVTGADRETLSEVITNRQKQSEVLTELNDLKSRHEQLLNEIERVTMQLTGGNIPLSQALSDRYEKQLLELETQREELKKQIDETKEQADALDDQLQPPVSAAPRPPVRRDDRDPFGAGEESSSSSDPFG